MTPCKALLLIWIGFISLSYAQITVVQTAEETGDTLTTKATVNWQADFPSPYYVIVNTSVTYQTILGFGAAFTEASAFVFSTLNATLQKIVLETFWGETGIHFSIGRVHMNSCDYCVTTYAEDSEPNDYTLSNFTIARDQKWLIPFIQAALKYAKYPINLYFTPWSPPAWMKINGHMNSSAMPLGLIQDPKIFTSWALYFSKFITAYKNIGINFWGFTIQNEPEYAAPYEACVWTAEFQRDFIKGYLGPRISADHPEVKIMIYDHNKDHVAIWAQTILSDPVAAQYVAGTAFHWYTGPFFENLEAAHLVDPSKFLLGTEMSSGGLWLDGESVGVEIMGDLNNWAVGYTAWNILLDPTGGPNHAGWGSNSGLIQADASKQTLLFNPPYYYQAQFSKFILPGSIRVNATCNEYLQCTAFLRPDKIIAVVVLNPLDFPTTFKLAQGTQAAKITIPQHSIATFTYPAF